MVNLACWFIFKTELAWNVIKSPLNKAIPIKRIFRTSLWSICLLELEKEGDYIHNLVGEKNASEFLLNEMLSAKIHFIIVLG